jgi:hypothetical protein
MIILTHHQVMIIITHHQVMIIITCQPIRPEANHFCGTIPPADVHVFTHYTSSTAGTAVLTIAGSSFSKSKRWILCSVQAREGVGEAAPGTTIAVLSLLLCVAAITAACRITGDANVAFYSIAVSATHVR